MAKHEPLEAASIWRLDIVHELLMHDSVAFRIVQQERFGAKSSKPTGLLACRLRELQACCDAFGTLKILKSVSIGRDSDGTFKTASLKEYPPFLFRALAMSFLQSLAEVHFAKADDQACSKRSDMVMPYDTHIGRWGKLFGRKTQRVAQARS